MNKNLKLIKSTGLKPLLFGKFYSSKNSEHTNSDVTIGESFDSIIQNLAQDTCIFIATRDKEVYSQIQTKFPSNRIIPLHLILNQSDQAMKKYNYWKITNKFGHWNYDGHKKVAEILFNFNALYKNK